MVTYNRKKLLIECISAILSQECNRDFDVLVIDNASTDGTKDAVTASFSDSRVTYINTGSNLGGAGGFSFGMREAAERGYGWAWVMDDDCIPSSGALAELMRVDACLVDGYGFLSSKVLWKDNSICRMNVQRETPFRSVRDFESAQVPVAMASFVSLLVPVANIMKYGLPIKEFFIWTDDWEFTRRLSRKLPSFLVNGSIVIHKSKSNIGADISIEGVDRLNRFGRLYRNDVYLYRREGIKGFLYEAARLTSHLVRVLVKAPGQRFLRMKMIIGGTARGLSFAPPIEYPRGGRADA